MGGEPALERVAQLATALPRQRLSVARRLARGTSRWLLRISRVDDPTAKRHHFISSSYLLTEGLNSHADGISGLMTYLRYDVT